MLAEFLVDAEKVDLSHWDYFAVGGHFDWDSRNKSEEFLLLSTAHANDPVRVVFGGSESPLKELDGVVKSEVAPVVFNVVV